MTSASIRTVLLVEDSEDDVILFQMSWRKAGAPHPLQHVEDGKQAIDYLGGNDAYANRGQFPLPFLMLLDLKLPEVDGFDVLQWTRARPAFDDLCVVILSSSPEAKDVQRAYQLGANSYLTKPAAPATLVELLIEVKDWAPADPRARLNLAGAERWPGQSKSTIA